MFMVKGIFVFLHTEDWKIVYSENYFSIRQMSVIFLYRIKTHCLSFKIENKHCDKETTVASFLGSVADDHKVNAP